MKSFVILVYTLLFFWSRLLISLSIVKFLILLFSQFRLFHFLSLFTLIQNVFRQMPMFGNSPYFRIVLIFFLKSLPIIYCNFFSFGYNPQFLACLIFPDSHIHVIRATEYILCIITVCNSINLLHSLSMINFSRFSSIMVENPYSLIK